MVKQVENVDGSVQCAVFQHHQLFDHVGHGPKGRQQHKYGQDDQKSVGYFIEKFQYGLSPKAFFHFSIIPLFLVHI